MEAVALVKMNIKKHLKAQGVSIADFCGMMGVNRNYINQISGGTSLLKLHTLAVKLNINTQDLFEPPPDDTTL